ncbi:MAG: hypothetical protein HDT06_05125 [Bacteroidales bacterium]|nr:hypothetical protein [Bacteroidales bacterium]
MSLFSSIVRAFGFGHDEDEEFETVISDEPDTPSVAAPATPEPAAAAEIPEAPATPAPVRPVVSAEMKGAIFTGVLEIFNSSLPDFLAKSIDIERQKQLMAERLDKSLDAYLDTLIADAHTYAENRLKHASEATRIEAEKLRNDMQQLEQQRTNLQEKQLSADRRRRALADRVTDLEAQLATSEAEREQFELENKSLLNKIKVAEIQPGVVDDLNSEIERLKAELENAPAPDEAPANTEELDALRRERDEALEQLQQTNDRLEQVNMQLRDHHGISQAMYTDLQKMYADECDARTKAQEELSTTAEALAAAEAERDSLRSAMQSLEVIQKQMGQIEEVINKRDEKIARLKANNKKLKEQLAEIRESRARRTAARLDDGLFAIPADQTPEQKKITSELASLEDDFECPDWFVAEPAPIPDRPDPAEFGYTEPPKKKRPENDAQLSLF